MSDYSYPPGRNSFFKTTNHDNDAIKSLGFESFFGSTKELMDTLYFHLQKTGGLYDFSNPSIICRFRSKHTFAVSRSKSNKGVEATLWDVPQWSRSQRGNGHGNDEEQRKRRLLVFNTHLDPWHVANRRTQIGEILDFMEKTLKSIEDTEQSKATVNNPQTTLYNGDERKTCEYDWSQTAVLVVGDFNIKAGSKEYWETLEYLRSTLGPSANDDGWKDYFFLPGETEDDTDQHTYAIQNSLAEYPNDCGRIDYIFGIKSFGKPLQRINSTSQQQSKYHRAFMPLNVITKSIRKEPMGYESSDHYALILELIPDG